MIETTITKIQYDADGVQRRWSIPFQYADAKHISIYTKVGEEPTVKVVDNYDIDEDDSVVIYPTVASGQEPVAAGTKITIARETPETQLEDASQVHFTSKDVERGLDKLTMITQELSTTAGETMEVSAAAFESAEEAVNSAAQAVGIATDAKSIAEGIDIKATQALANSTTALEAATEAKNTADSYQGQITTIESKIPSAASDTNQLADKQFVQDLTSALNFVQWVDALPETGESKYIYAVPREETDTDGKQIAALYLWDGSAWRGAGAFSLNIDPATLATKSELSRYLPLTGGTINGELKVVGPKSTIKTYSGDKTSGYTYLELKAADGNQAAIILTNNAGETRFRQSAKNTEIKNITYNKSLIISSILKFDNNKVLDASDKAVANGVASLDANTKVPENQLPDSVANQAILREW